MSKRKNKRRAGRDKRRDGFRAAKATPQHNGRATIKPKPQPAPELEPGMAWHCVYTNPKCERRAAMGLRAKGFTVYLPEYDSTATHARKVTEIKRVLFPRYLFVGFKPVKDGVDGGQWWAIKSVDGVEAVLCDPVTFRPKRIKTEQIARLVERIEEPVADLSIALGAILRIIDGPFASFSGAVTAIDGDGVTVEADIFGRKTPVKLDLQSVERCDTVPLLRAAS